MNSIYLFLALTMAICQPSPILAETDRAEYEVPIFLLKQDTTKEVDLSLTTEGEGTDIKARFLEDIIVNEQKERKPGRAVFLSAVLPGAGQAYNGDYLKTGVLYGIIGGLFYGMDFNRNQYDRFSLAYEQRLAGEEDEFRGIIPSARGIKNFRDQFRKDLELTYIGLGATYLFNVIDAFVGAHLSSFDLDDDLSVDWRPKMIATPSSRSVGIGLTINF